MQDNKHPMEDGKDNDNINYLDRYFPSCLVFYQSNGGYLSLGWAWIG
jgi:hypothetical protein